jgi:hypothetical protein
VWAASPDAGQVLRLDGAVATQFIGWISDETVVAYRGGGYAFDYAHRTINVATGEIDYLEPRCFSGLAYNLEQNAYLVWISDFELEACEMGDDWKNGLYLFTGDEARLVHELDTENYAIDLMWSPLLHMFTGETNDQKFGVTLEGEFVEKLPTDIPRGEVAISGDGLYWAWIDDGGLKLAMVPDYVPVRMGTRLSFDYRTVLVWVP